MLPRFSLLALVLGAGCFVPMGPPGPYQPYPPTPSAAPVYAPAPAPAPQAAGPQQAPTQQNPTPRPNNGMAVTADSPGPQAAAADSLGGPPQVSAGPAPAPPPTNPRPVITPTQPPSSDPLDPLTFTTVLSWGISGNTPLASWSPSRGQLVVFSDLPQKEGEKNGKKYVDLLDTKSGKSKKLGTITATGYEPMWLDETTLVFLCDKSLCGKGKDGVYTLKTTGGGQKQIIEKGPNTYLYLFPTKSGSLLIKHEEYPPALPDGSYQEPKQYWEEWDPKTKAATARADLSPKVWDPPQGVYEPQYCDTQHAGLYGFAKDGKIGVMNYKTKKERVVTEEKLWPYYPGDNYGYSPCFSPDGGYMIYYSLDASQKGRATLVQVGGMPTK